MKDKDNIKPSTIPKLRDIDSDYGWDDDCKVTQGKVDESTS